MWVIHTKGTTPYSLSMKWAILQIWRLMIMVCKRATALHSMWDHLGHKLVCSNAKVLQLDILSHLWTLQSKILAWKITARWIDINIITQMGKLRKKKVICFASVVLWKGKNGKTVRNPFLNCKIILLSRYRDKQKTLICPFPCIWCVYCFYPTPSIKTKPGSHTNMWTLIGKSTSLRLGCICKRKVVLATQ